jgi:hypothetical protein
MAKDTKVILVNATPFKDKEGNEVKEKEYSLKHAEATLKYQETHPQIPASWSLKPEQGFIYENGTITQSDTGKAQKPAKNLSNTDGGNA